MNNINSKFLPDTFSFRLPVLFNKATVKALRHRERRKRLIDKLSDYGKGKLLA